jgi:hypothetical protein
MFGFIAIGDVASGDPVKGYETMTLAKNGMKAIAIHPE